MRTSKGLKTLVERAVAINTGGRVNKTRDVVRQKQGLMRCVAERLYMMTSVASVISADEELGAVNTSRPLHNITANTLPLLHVCLNVFVTNLRVLLKSILVLVLNDLDG